MHLLRWIQHSGFWQSQTVSLAEARGVIQDGNIEWGKARVAIDKNTFERMLAPDLYVQYSDRRLTRQQFIDRISSYPPGVSLTRFDASVLTVEPNGDDWVAIILERIEYEKDGPAAKPKRSMRPGSPEMAGEK